MRVCSMLVFAAVSVLLESCGMPGPLYLPSHGMRAAAAVPPAAAASSATGTRAVAP